MLTRRDLLRSAAVAGAAFTLRPDLLSALGRQEMLTRPIPSTGERIPVVGLGSSDSFARLASDGNVERIGAIFQALVDNGGAVFDTAPSYARGASEEVAGQAVAERGLTDRIFWATKVNVAGRGGGGADPEAARAQIERSFRNLRDDNLDLIQVHNLGDPPTQLGILEELKAEGRIRHMGITSTSQRRYGDLEAVMREYPLDFIGVDYAIDNRTAAERILPLAQDRGIGVLVYLPFGRRRLWSRTEGREVPAWAADEIDAHTWAQFFIKFIVAHPAITCVTPATSNPDHMIDDLLAGVGRVPNADQLERMIADVDALPEAG